MFEIQGKNIGSDHPPYIVAELSANHNGEIQKAKKAISCAKKAGADAIKIQTYTPDTMTFDPEKPDFIIQEGLWKGRTLYDLYNEAHTPYEWHPELFDYARKVGITLFSSPFDESAVDLLDELNAPAYKIASFEITDHSLIKYAAKKMKPMLLSTGMANLQEIGEAIECCTELGNHQILLFHCISEYPANTRSMKLDDIRYLKDHFNLEVGLSDHSKSNLAAVLSVAIGASAIEKHFKIVDDDEGPDSVFSLLPNELEDLVKECRLAFEATRSNKLQRSKSEKSNKIFRRSLYFSKNLEPGHIITEDDIRRVRPGYGLNASLYDEIIGRKVQTAVERADRVRWDLLELE